MELSSQRYIKTMHKRDFNIIYSLGFGYSVIRKDASPLLSTKVFSASQYAASTADGADWYPAEEVRRIYPVIHQLDAVLRDTSVDGLLVVRRNVQRYIIHYVCPKCVVRICTHLIIH